MHHTSDEVVAPPPQRRRQTSRVQAGPNSRFTVQREDAFDFLGAEYGTLFAASEATAFQHGAWLHRIYDGLAADLSAHPRVVTIRDANTGALAAVLPLVHRKRGPVRVVEFADLGVSDYAKPVVATAAAAALHHDATVKKGIRAALAPFDLVLVQRVPDSPHCFTALLPGSKAALHHYGTHRVCLPESVEEWPQTLEPSFQRHLSRKYRRLRPKGGCQLRLVSDPAEVDSLMGTLRRFRRVRFSEHGGLDLLQEPRYFDFYSAVARDGVQGRGPARLNVLDVGGRPGAIALDLADPDGEVYLVIGYDLERLRNYSLGLLIVDQLARSVIERGGTVLDLTVGDEPYKAQFGAQRSALYEVRVARTPWGWGLYVGHRTYRRARRAAKRVVEAGRAARGQVRQRAQDAHQYKRQG